MKRFWFIWVIGLAGCQDIGEIPFQTIQPIVVVEGWLTDQPGHQYVQLSSTVDFTSSTPSDPIEDAEITLYAGSERLVRYIHLHDGVYRTENSMQGMTGRRYHLEIVLATGEVIRSGPERMPDVAPIDSLGFDSFLREREDNPQEEEEIYFPVAFSDDPAGPNFYRWKLYKNDTLFSKAEDIFLFSDRFTDGNSDIPQEFASYEYRLNDTAKVEILEISQTAFQFLNQLKSQKTTLGTNSAVSPAPITGNLYYPDNPEKQVLGYFGIVSLKSREKIVE